MESKKPEISVIVPVYKVEPYLRRCLDSIVDQTYRNLEIILVDDGSPDDCGTICDEYAARDKRIIVIHQENKGLSEARNAGLDIASGDYVQFVDSDDWIEKETCEQTIALALEHDADVVCFGHREVYPSGEVLTWGTDISGEIEKVEMIRQLVWINTRNYVWSKFFSKGLLEGIRFPAGRTYEDITFIQWAIHQSHCIYTTPCIYYNYMRRDDSLAAARYSPGSIKDILFAWENRLDFLTDHYPEHAEKMMSEILWQRIAGREQLKGDPDYPAFLKESDDFERKYRSEFKSLTKYGPLIRLYVHCRPLARLYARWRFHK